MKRQKNRRRAAVLVGCILLACIACVRLVTAYGVLRPNRPPEQLRLSAGKEWTGAVKLEEFGGLCWDATQQEVQDALAFCNSCTQFPREEEGALMLGMGATFRQLVLERGPERYTVSLLPGRQPNALVEYAWQRDGEYQTLWQDFYQGDAALWDRAEQAVRRIEDLR